MSEGTAVEPYLEDGDLTAAGWSRALRDGVLLGQRCANGHVTAAPKAACAKCGNRALEVEQLPTEGSVYTETTIEVAPTGFEAPYDVALVDLGEARVLGRVTEDVDVEDEVVLDGVVEREVAPAPLFEPI